MIWRNYRPSGLLVGLVARTINLVRAVFRTRRIMVWVLIVSLVVNTFAFSSIAKAFDTTRDNYLNNGYYNNLIADGDFTDINAWTVEQIQSFLSTKGSYLASAPSNQLGDGAGSRSAAQIIWDASHGYREASGTLNGITISTTTGTVNPKILLTTLQKEQSLISRASYDQRAYDCAMGYEGGHGCTWMFDNRPQWKGFTNQVEWGAWQLRYNFEASKKDDSWWTTNYGSGTHYNVGRTMSLSWTGYGVFSVTLNNAATGALYRYTPYVGFGNYNFWSYSIAELGVPPYSGGTISAGNDTDTVTVATYRSSFTARGSKATDVTVWHSSSQIAGMSDTTWQTTLQPAVGSNVYLISYLNGEGQTVATKSITLNRRKTGDVDGTNKVDLLDLSLLGNSWGQHVEGDAYLNLNPEVDSEVNLLDLSLFANAWEG